MSTLSVCVFNDDEGKIDIWTEAGNNLKELKMGLENTFNHTVLCAFSIQSSDFESKEAKVLFNALVAMEEAMHEGQMTFRLTDLLEKIFVRFLQETSARIDKQPSAD